MTIPNDIWPRVQHIPVDGFNPSPYQTDHRCWVTYRRQTGTYARGLSLDLETAETIELVLHQHLDDCRIVPGTRPALAIASFWNSPPRQTLAVIDFRPDQVSLLTPTLPLRLANGGKHADRRAEKNWQPFLDPDGNLFAFYNAHPLTIMAPTQTPQTWHIHDRQAWKLPDWAAKLERPARLSTSPLPFGYGLLIWFWHIKDSHAGYWTGATLSKTRYPFQPVRTFRRPLLTPADASDVSPHWAPNTCVYPMSADKPDSDHIRIWAGDSDRTSIALTTAVHKLRSLAEEA